MTITGRIAAPGVGMVPALHPDGPVATRGVVSGGQSSGLFFRADGALPANGGATQGLPIEDSAPDLGRNRGERIGKRRRRVLVAAASQRLRRDLAGALAQEGHEVIQVVARGAVLVSVVERASPLHALVVSQEFLGAGCPGLVRQLRRRAPRVPVILLLRPGAEWAWRFAFVAGAYDALPASADAAAVFAAVCRALTCPMARDPAPGPPSREKAARAGAALRSAAGRSHGASPGAARP